MDLFDLETHNVPMPKRLMDRNARLWLQKDILLIGSDNMPAQCFRLQKKPIPAESVRMYASWAKRFRQQTEQQTEKQARKKEFLIAVVDIAEQIH